MHLSVSCFACQDCGIVNCEYHDLSKYVDADSATSSVCRISLCDHSPRVCVEPSRSRSAPDFTPYHQTPCEADRSINDRCPCGRCKPLRSALRGYSGKASCLIAAAIILGGIISRCGEIYFGCFNSNIDKTEMHRSRTLL